MVDLNFTLWVQLVNFLVLLILLHFLLFKPLLKHVEDRERTIEGIGKDAERIRRQSEKILEEYEQQLEEARSASSQIILSAKGGAEEKYRVIVENARKNLREQVMTARKKLNDEIPKAKSMLEEDAHRVRDILVNKILEGAN